MLTTHLLFFIADLVAVIYPATLEMIGHYLAAIAPSILSTEINVPTLVNLGVAMNLLKTISLTDSGVTGLYYAPADPTGLGRPFHHSRLLYLEGSARRARFRVTRHPPSQASASTARKCGLILHQMSSDLGLPSNFLWNFAKGASHAYRTYHVEKKDGNVRTIHHPSKQLKAMQRWLVDAIISKWPVHPAATAYRTGKSIFDNARAHAASKYLLRMDCQDFFPSITELDIRHFIADKPTLFPGWMLTISKLFADFSARSRDW